MELVDVPRRCFVYRDPPSGREVIVDLVGVPFFTLWSDGGPFLCVEPCWGLTDHHQQRPFEEKAGIQAIPAQANWGPDSKWNRDWQLQLKDASCDNNSGE